VEDRLAIFLLALEIACCFGRAAAFVDGLTPYFRSQGKSKSKGKCGCSSTALLTIKL
jgi:hypothetical protein